MLPTAELLVSELANNALFNGHGLITLRARLNDERVLVDVVDEGPEIESDKCDTGFEHEGPWGLDIVANLSQRWGVHEGTNHVWVEFELAGSRPAAADVR
jgi:anti-sigma regulatory factor (Ser/Thr protein kinase)